MPKERLAPAASCGLRRRARSERRGWRARRRPRRSDQRLSEDDAQSDQALETRDARRVSDANEATTLPEMDWPLRSTTGDLKPTCPTRDAP
jgi:hypothetical protein